MARRRYLSTDISVDPRVSDLAMEAGPYAALLYTWLIPHADDTRAIPSDPRMIKLQVVPGLDHCDVQTIAEALGAMLRLGLLVDDCGVLRFPESFYKHQSYIKDDRRRSAQNAANPRNAPLPAQNAASSSFSSSFPVPVSPPVSEAIASSSATDPPDGQDEPSETTKVAALAASQQQKPVSLLVALSDGATAALEAWRFAHGKRSPPKLNPTQVAKLEKAVVELGLEWLRFGATWSAERGIPEFDKAINAAYTARQNSENGSNSHGENRQPAGGAGSGTGRAAAGPGARRAVRPDPFAQYVRRDPVPNGDPGRP